MEDKSVPSNSFYFKLNSLLREEDRSKLKPFFPYIRLISEGLLRLNTHPGDIWRGVKGDVSSAYTVGKKVTWWGFSSCTTDLKVLEGNDSFLGTTGERTLFKISPLRCFNISQFSCYTRESEVLLLPGTYLIVTGKTNKDNGLVLVELEECVPLQKNFCCPPYQEAKLVQASLRKGAMLISQVLNQELNLSDSKWRKLNEIYNILKSIGGASEDVPSQCFLVGATNAGKSTFGNGLLANVYKQPLKNKIKLLHVSGHSETCTFIKVLPTTDSKFTLKIFTDQGTHIEDFLIQNAKQLERKLSNLNYEKNVSGVEIMYPKKKTEVMDFILWDTPGVSEIGVKDQVENKLNQNLIGSAVFYIVNMTDGGWKRKLEDHETAKIFEHTSYRLIFVLTHLLHYIENNRVDEDGVDEDGVDEDGVDEDGVDEVGVDEDGADEDGVDVDMVKLNRDIREHFIKPIHNTYPKAKIVIYDCNTQEREYHYAFHRFDYSIIKFKKNAPITEEYISVFRPCLQYARSILVDIFNDKVNTVTSNLRNELKRKVEDIFTLLGDVNNNISVFEGLLKKNVDSHFNLFKENLEKYSTEIDGHLSDILTKFDKGDSYHFNRSAYENNITPLLQQTIIPKMQNFVLNQLRETQLLMDKDIKDIEQQLAVPVSSDSNIFKFIGNLVAVATYMGFGAGAAAEHVGVTSVVGPAAVAAFTTVGIASIVGVFSYMWLTDGAIRRDSLRNYCEKLKRQLKWDIPNLYKETFFDKYYNEKVMEYKAKDFGYRYCEVVKLQYPQIYLIIRNEYLKKTFIFDNY